jgi:hypothetical protein
VRMDYSDAWPDRPMMYSDCPMLCADGLNWLFRFCAGCGGLGADFGNSIWKKRDGRRWPGRSGRA